MKNKDDAVSSVVAIMLILAVVVVCIAVLSSSYIPDLKENSEIIHSDEVKSGFLKFSDDINRVYSSSETGEFSTTFSLGGGDILFSPSKSSGTVKIQNIILGNITIVDVDKGTVNGSYPINTVNMTYNPVMPYWENQGYFYEKGVVWVVKDNVSVPYLSDLYSVDDGIEYEDNVTKSWLNSMNNSVTIINETWMYDGQNQYVWNLIHGLGGTDTITITPDFGLNPGSVDGFTHFRDNVSIDIICVSADKDYNFLSGSSDAVIKVSSEKTSYTVNIPKNGVINYEDEIWYKAPCYTNLTINRIDANVKVI